MFNLCEDVCIDVNTLFKENHSLAVKHLDKMRLFKYTARGKNPYELHEELDKILVSMKGMGYKRPNITEMWLKGDISGAAALELVNLHLDDILSKKPHSTTTQLLKDVAKLTFSPDILCNVLELNSKSLHLLKSLKKKGECKIYLVGNLDSQTFKALKTKHPNVFAHFNDTFISFQNHEIKPDKKFIDKMFKALSLTPGKTCLVDDSLSDSKFLSTYGLNVFDVYTVEKNIA